MPDKRANLPGAPAAPLNTGPRVGAMGAPPPLEAPKGPGGASSIGTAPAATAASQTLGKAAGVLTPWREWDTFSRHHALSRLVAHKQDASSHRMRALRNQSFISALLASAPAAAGLAGGGAALASAFRPRAEEEPKVADAQETEEQYAERVQHADRLPWESVIPFGNLYVGAHRAAPGRKFEGAMRGWGGGYAGTLGGELASDLLTPMLAGKHPTLGKALSTGFVGLGNALGAHLATKGLAVPQERPEQSPELDIKTAAFRDARALFGL